MKNLQEVCIEEGVSIGEAVQKLDSAGYKILLVTKNGKLTGIVTDGDVRRWILKKGDFASDIINLMCKEPKVVLEEQVADAKKIMLQARIDAIPVINKENRPVDIIFIRDLIEDVDKNYRKVDAPVVIMAGGKGTRLFPYTSVLPKPLIPIGSKTILERIIDSFQKNGCNKFFLTLNYKKNLIKAYFDEKEEKALIKYIEETDYYGTCGCLSMLKEKIRESFFVSNCDVLLDIDYAKLYDFHKEHQNEITAVTSLKHFKVPYGVFELEHGGLIQRIVEKPEYNYQVNTGVYLLEASVLEDIPKGEVYQMTDLMDKLLAEGRRVGAYPVTENAWKDMGEISELQKMVDSFQIE